MTNTKRDDPTIIIFIALQILTLLTFIFPWLFVLILTMWDGLNREIYVALSAASIYILISIVLDIKAWIKFNKGNYKSGLSFISIPPIITIIAILIFILKIAYGW